ncbi:uncharacterized protein K452DRAFT_116374 [Aplosporella prunicola CBS 121167]|uniref:XPG-I domain-containing protein n=1 Tax=Aplosporella prunicola CBS 121167 TaxID=1176127 RepID=A0A6A6AYX2_9PEZI|nr:uncharacterized protein K452DRAFT_116374 [Aplosporella prunicola CBS 121167]KAF2136980.1 hypothetical protein K452DRAFT_116374 [Aplosporella prunicola CBS 121167]
MGITGIYKEIGVGERVALSKLAVEKFEQTGRPLRIAIDTSIWLFQIQSSKGGTNPALRTFYYRLLRLLSLSIHPIFIFDGPNKPPFKRNKRTGPNVASIPEFLAKQLLKQFGFPIHLAPGEAEAECALLQREGIVDAVLTEDVDVLMFGSGMSLRNWTPEARSSKVPTHVNLYDAQKIKAGPSGLDREGMILVALMSGGDYLPEGIPGCGPKIACEAAKAGYGQKLCAISKRDTVAIQQWKEELVHELRTNQSKHFKRKHMALTIPDDFPRADILGYYTNPAISSREGIERLKSKLKWDQNLDFPALRSFTADAFDWVKLGGAKKFIRNLAPALLVRHLRMRGQLEATGFETPEALEAAESKLVASIHGTRQHPSTDNTGELRIAYTPINVVNIDLSIEEPDDELEEASSAEDDMPPADDDNSPDNEPAPKRGPSLYDPNKPEKIWILESFVKVGAPLKVQDWEEAQRKKASGKRTTAAAKTAKPKRAANGGMQRDRSTSVEKLDLSHTEPLKQFARVSKPGVSARKAPGKQKSPSVERLDLSGPPPSIEPPQAQWSSRARRAEPDLPELNDLAPVPAPALAPTQAPAPVKDTVCIDLLSSSPAAKKTASPPPQPSPPVATDPPHLDEHYLSPNVTKRARRNLRRTESAPVNQQHALPSTEPQQPPITQNPAGELFTSSASPAATAPLSLLRALAPPQRSRTSVRRSASASNGVASKTTRSKRGASAGQTSPPTEGVVPHAPHERQQLTIEQAFLRRSASESPRKVRPSLRAPTPLPGIEEVDLTESSPVRAIAPVSTAPTLPAVRQTMDVPMGLDGVDEADELPSLAALVSARGGVEEEGLQRPRPRQRQRGRNRDNEAAEASSVGNTVSAPQTAPQLPDSPPQKRKHTPGKEFVQLRRSLDGTWRFAGAEEAEVEMAEGRNDGVGTGKVAPKRRAWRRSEVEVVDLTAE